MKKLQNRPLQCWLCHANLQTIPELKSHYTKCYNSKKVNSI